MKRQALKFNEWGYFGPSLQGMSRPLPHARFDPPTGERLNKRMHLVKMRANRLARIRKLLRDGLDRRGRELIG